MLAELEVFLIAMSPILELRGSIPVALGAYHLPVWSAFLISVLGNIVPVVFILLLLESVSGYLSRHSRFSSRFLPGFLKEREKNMRKPLSTGEIWP